MEEYHFLCLFLHFAVLVVSLEIKTGYRVQASLANSICAADRKTFEKITISAIACALQAAKNSTSVGVSYSEEHRICHGCESFVDETGRFEFMEGAVFYRRVNSTSAGYTDVDGYVLRVVQNLGMYEEAACNPNERLLRIDTLAKQRAIQRFLRLRSNAEKQYYWIQGRQARYDKWRFLDGTIIPLNATFWSWMEPKIYTTSICVSLWSRNGFAWVSWRCHERYMWICENGTICVSNSLEIDQTLCLLTSDQASRCLKRFILDMMMSLPAFLQSRLCLDTFHHLLCEDTC